MDNPPSPAEARFMPGQHITPPPQFLPADVAHQHHDSIVDGNPPGTLQRDAHEIVRTEMTEELGVEPRRVEESYRLQCGLKQRGVSLDERAYQNRNEQPLLPRPLFP